MFYQDHGTASRGRFGHRSMSCCPAAKSLTCEVSTAYRTFVVEP